MDPSSQVGFTSPSSHFGLPWDRLHGGPVRFLIVDCCQDSCKDCCQDCCPGTGCTVGLWYIWLLIFVEIVVKIVVKTVAKTVALGPAARWACDIFSFPECYLLTWTSCSSRDSLHSILWDERLGHQSYSDSGETRPRKQAVLQVMNPCNMIFDSCNLQFAADFIHRHIYN